MSEIPYIAIDDQIQNLTQTADKVFTGTGNLVAPFHMLEISKEQKFSFLKSDEHIYISFMPLWDDCYYLIYIKCATLMDISQTDYAYFLQSETITSAAADFTFYYTKVKKPFNISNVHLTIHEYPLTYLSRQVRTGIIPNVVLADETNAPVIISEDNLTIALSDDDIANVLKANYYDIIDVGDDPNIDQLEVN